ncbi:SH3 domain-containing protein [Terrilactibacillus sp. S3-3]|nr:SH3 domain-containing protein [Terrilactibacillus sp. S3-3]
MRKSASASSTVLGSLKKGSSVSVVGTSGNWLKIKYKSGYAYVSGSYVKKASSAAASSSSSKQAADLNTLYTGTVTADYLNVRKSASASSAVLGALKKGSSVSVVGTSGNWLKIKYKSGYAYVSGSYVKKASSAAKPSSAKQAANLNTYTGTVTADYLNVRKAASASSTILGSLKEGSSVSVVGTSGNWLKVKYKSGYAYVSGSYVKKASASSGSSTSSSTSTSAGSTVLYTGTVTADYLNVRSSSSTSSTILGSLKKGSSVSVVGTSGNWLKIKYKSGYAYVSASYVKKAAASSGSSTPLQTSTSAGSTVFYIPVQ